MSPRLSHAFATCLLLTFAANLAFAEIRINDVKDGETIRHPLMLLRGEATGPGPLRITDADGRLIGVLAEAPIVQGRFVALVELRPGRNHLALDCGDRSPRKLTLTFKPTTTEYRLKLVYVTDRDGATSYITQHLDDHQNYADRLDTAAKLLQTFTAETLHDQGLGRKTFALELDERGKVVVHVARYPESADVLRGKSGDDLHRMLYGWINDQFPMDRTKSLVIAAFSDYDPVQKEASVQGNLGGGLGLFSNLFLSCWPESPADVPHAFLDRTPVNRDKVFRHVSQPTLDRLASTSLGAALHAMGHAFGLPHADDARCIMSPGCDRFRLAFLAADMTDKGLELVKPEQTAWFSPFMAVKLAHSRWFQPDARGFDESSPPTIRFNFKHQRFEIEAAHGIESVFIHNGPNNVKNSLYMPVKGSPRTLAVPLREFRAGIGKGGTPHLTVFDDEFNQADFDASKVTLPALYLSRWRLSGHSLPCPDLDAPPPKPDEIAAITASLRERPLNRAPTDPDGSCYSAHLLAVYGPSTNTVAYALRDFESEQARAAKILIGGDDGYRVWLNGKLVIDRPGGFASAPDSSTADVQFIKGHNEILVQSLQATDNWGFELRLADGEGRPIALGADVDATPLNDRSLYLTSWQLIGRPLEHPDLNAPPPSGEDLVALTRALREQARKRPPANIEKEFYSADLNAVYGASTNVVAYALREVRSDQARDAKILVGGDDGFRVWFNGKLVIDRPSDRVMPPDSASATVTFVKGRNEILVQSMQAGEFWGFSVRLTDLDGKPIVLDARTERKPAPARPGARRPWAR